MPPSNFIAHFDNYPLKSFWRLFIDGNRQEQVGPRGFEKNEPGYLKSIQNGFGFAMDSLDKPLTVHFLIQLHDRCMQDVLYPNYPPEDQAPETGIRDFDHHGFGLVAATQEATHNTSLAGVKEFFEKKKAP
ncbi:hypothetical protein ACD661_11615 [Legionella lytica]|uniref:Uncharacterized protein n=1 Tax=Legionella lytica TaxID=96232 RepID=A0ABW8DDA0_9GAMM